MRYDRPRVLREGWILAIISLLLAGAARAEEPIVERDVTYRTVDGETLELDVARPPGANSPLPLVVCIHGGGWHKGNRAFWRGQMTEFAKAGFVSSTVSYRLAPKYKWPAQIEDVKAAIRYLRAHATQYGIDPKRVAVIGDSAGGHLSLMVGLTDDDQFEAGENQDQPTKVQAVVNYYGSIDMRTWQLNEAGRKALGGAFEGKNLDQLLDSLFGTSDRADARLAGGSPATYADAEDPPVITFQGTADILVPIEEARQFDEAAKKAGVAHELVILEGANHGWGGALREKTNRQTLEFLNKHLR
jgi:acetyl esterase/lipase